MSEPTKTVHLTQGEIDEALFLLEMADLENSNYTSLVQKLKTVRAQGGEGKPVEGDMVSIDVSTCDDDSGNRVFGRIVDRQSLSPDGGRVWLCELDSFNYAIHSPAPAPAQGVPDLLRVKVEDLCKAVINDDELPPIKFALRCGRLVNEVRELLSTTPGNGEWVRCEADDLGTAFKKYKRAVMTGARRDKVQVDERFSFADFRAGYKAGQWNPILPQPPVQGGE